MNEQKDWNHIPCCKGCAYRSVQHTCDYYLITGRRRPSTAENVWDGKCSVRLDRKMAEVEQYAENYG